MTSQKYNRNCERERVVTSIAKSQRNEKKFANESGEKKTAWYMKYCKLWH